jgi:hypothetical protein
MAPLKKEKLLPSHKVSRTCLPKTVVNGTITPAAFMLREGEPYMSVNWLEYYSSLPPDERIQRCQQDFLSKWRSLTPQQKSRYRSAILPVGLMASSIKKDLSTDLEVWHFDSKKDPSYAGIFGLPEDDLDTAEYLLGVVEGVYPLS